MLVECLVVFFLVAAVIIMSLRVGKKAAAVKITPMLIVPFMYIAANYIARPLANVLPMNSFAVYLVFIVIGAVITALLIGCFINKFERRSLKIVYGIMCMGFNVIFSAVLAYDIYTRLF